METDLTTRELTESPVSAPSDLSAETFGRKRCPFCAELIYEMAIKCRYCNEFLDGSRRSGPHVRRKGWYHATPTVVFALLCLGPLALPLVWLNPRFKPATKVIVSLIVFAVTIACSYLMAAAYQKVLEQIDILGI